MEAAILDPSRPKRTQRRYSIRVEGRKANPGRRR